MFRLWKMFSLIFLLMTFSASGVESATHALSMSRVTNGRLLSSHSLHHSSVRGLTDCVHLCLRHFEECSSIAYEKDSKICDVFASKSEYQLVTLMFPTNVLLYMVYSKFEEVATTPSEYNEVATTYRDCTDVKQQLSGESGVYQIKPCTSCDAFPAYCDMDTDGKAWTVFHRRHDGSVDFYQNWQNYTSGFGNLSGEFWLGNEKIYNITSSAKYEFRIDMVTNDDNAYHVTYESIEIGSEAENFTLNLGDYIAANSTAFNRLAFHNGMSFSTLDRDNDLYVSSCGSLFKSGWWFKSCIGCNLNGEYESNVFRWDYYTILRFSEMKIRRVV